MSNLDSGFVRPEQSARLKLVAFPFQQYGMLDGVVTHVSADSSDKSGSTDKTQPAAPPLFYRALIELKSSELGAPGQRLTLVPGMQVNAEINLGSRSVLDYLLSPVRKTVHEAWRER